MLRTIPTILLAIGLCGCVPLVLRDPARVPPDEARNSIYKIGVEMTMAAISDDPNAEPEEPVHTGWHGTAWVMDRGNDRSVVMTAGHVCESGERYHDEGFPPFVPAQDYQILTVKYSLEAADGTVYEGARVLQDDDALDLCALTVPGNLGRPLAIADGDPAYGAHATNIGAPNGIWGGGIATINELIMNGRGQIFGKAHAGRDALAFTGLAAAGSSGSPIMYDGRVVGVLTLGTVRYVRLVTAVPWDILRDFERRVRHTPPE